MKIVALSDLHGYLPDNIPPCDVVCICGDILPLEAQRCVVRSVSWLCLDFKPWAESLPCKNVIFIAGNHDFVFETLGPKACRRPNEVMYEIFGEHIKTSKLIYLRDETVTIDGVKFYGTPWCPVLVKWAFYKPQNELIDTFMSIPGDIDVLLTHYPPKVGDVGKVLEQDTFNYGKDFGSDELSIALANKPNIRFVLSGHIHSGSHEINKINNTSVVNVSIKNEMYKVKYNPYEFEIDRRNNE